MRTETDPRQASWQVERRALRARVQELEVLERDRDRARLEGSVLAGALREIGEPVCIADTQDRILFANRAFQDAYGYSEDELLGKPADLLRSERTPPDRFEEVLRATLKGGWQGELWHRRKDGTDFPVRLATSVVRDEKSWPIAFISIVKDISERKRTEETLRRHGVYLDAVHETALGLMSRLELSDLLATIMRKAADLAGTEHGYLYLLEPDHGTMRMRVAIGVMADRVGYEISRGEGVGGMVWDTGRPFVVNDYDTWPGRLASMAKGVVHAAAAVPLGSGDHITGVIGLAYLEEGRSFGPESVSLLSQFAELAAIAIENARLFETERAARQEAETLRKATQVLGATLDLQQVFESILTQLQKVVPHTSASVQRLVGDRLRIIGGHGFANLDAVIGLSFALDDPSSPNGEVIRTRRPMILDDAPETYAAFRSEAHAPIDVRSWMGIPLIIGDRPIGMISVETSKPRAFTDAHVRLATAFGAQAAIAIENARLYGAVQAELAERRRAEAELERSIALLKATFESTADAILALGSDGSASFNMKFADLWRLPPELLAERESGPLLAHMASLLPEPEALAPYREAELEHLELSDSRTFERFSQDQRAGDEVVGRVLSFRDVTQRIRNEALLRAAKEAAEAGSRAKSAFLANMSHELRTPLNAILGYAEMLEELANETSEEGFLPDLGRIRSAGRHLLALINDILDLSKIEAGKMELSPETFEIATMADEVLDTIRSLLPRNGNALEVEGLEGAGTMTSDRTRVKQVLYNLLSNATKFTHQGTVSLSVLRAETGGVLFRVADTGIGISREQLAGLFTPFTQADVSTSRKYGGTGLGLVISRRLCQLMGGTLEVESEPGRGSVFTARLPTSLDVPTMV